MNKKSKELDTKKIEIALQRLDTVYPYMNPCIQEAIDTLSETVEIFLDMLVWLLENPKVLEGSLISRIWTEDIKDAPDRKN